MPSAPARRRPRLPERDARRAAVPARRRAADTGPRLRGGGRRADADGDAVWTSGGVRLKRAFVRGGAREPARRRAATTDLAARTRRTADVARMFTALAPRTTAYLRRCWRTTGCSARAGCARSSTSRRRLALPPRTGRCASRTDSTASCCAAPMRAGACRVSRTRRPSARTAMSTRRSTTSRTASCAASTPARARTLARGASSPSATRSLDTAASPPSRAAHVGRAPPAAVLARTGEWLFDSERFHADECPDDDVWPQRAAAAAQQLARGGCARCPRRRRRRRRRRARVRPTRLCW